MGMRFHKGLGMRVLHKGDVAVAVRIGERGVFARFSGFVSGVRGGGLVVWEMGMVRNVFLAIFTADGRPAEAAANGFDEIPRVEGVEERFHAVAAAFIGFANTVQVEVRIPRRRSEGMGFIVMVRTGVDAPGVCPEMEDTKAGHFDTQ